MPDTVWNWIQQLAPAGTSELVLPATRLTVDPEVLEPRLGAHRAGGNPDLPPGFAWPRWREACMDFIAQIDLGALPKGTGLPERGWLWFFYTAYAETWGNHPNERESCAVFHEVCERADLRRSVLPIQDDRDTVYPPSALVTSHLWTLPSSNADVIGDRLGGADLEAYVELERRIGEHEDTNGGASWLLGHANQFQGIDLASIAEENGPAGEGPWRLLLQLCPPDDWGFVGVLYFMIRAGDLAAGRFDRIWLVRED